MATPDAMCLKASSTFSQRNDSEYNDGTDTIVLNSVSNLNKAIVH